MSKPSSRLIQLIMLLQRRPNQKAADLAELLDVSIRTVHRYFESLEEMGIPIYSERGPHGGFSLVRGYRMPPLVFTPEEAVAVSLGSSLVGRMWGDVYAEAGGGALAKLDNVLPDEQRAEVAWAQRSLVVTRMHRANPSTFSPFLETIRQGARQQRALEMTYQGTGSGKKTDRIVDPYALVHGSGWWYMVGYCRLREALRTFRVDRIRSLALLDLAFERPEDFDARAYLAHAFSDQTAVQARLRFTPQAAHIAQANIENWDEITENADGSVEVLMSAPDLHWLGSFTLSFANWVTVLEPPELRALVRDWALATAANYQADESERKVTP